MVVRLARRLAAPGAAADEVDLAEDPDGVLAVAEGGERRLVVAHDRRFAVADDADAGELVRGVRIGVDGDGRQPVLRQRVVTQTQAVLESTSSPAEMLGALFTGKPIAEQQQLLETLGRAGAGLYRRMAETEQDPAVRQELLASAEREELNAAALARLRRR
jgi:hypothetical protein